jgi:hypothetical protein
MANKYVRNNSLLNDLLTTCGVKKLLSVLNGAATASGSSTGVFYVSKKYQGIGAAVITAAGISSPNAEWTAQYERAQVNDPAFAFPDPYAAMIAAKKAMTEGSILKAVIVIEEGSNWTVGSDNPALNGTAGGNAAQAEVADIGMSSTIAADMQLGSLVQDQIHFVFKAQSGLHFINRSYVVRMGYHHDNGAGNRPFSCGVYGQGIFTQLYGEFHGFAAELIRIDNPNAVFTFACALVKLQQWRGFGFFNFKLVTIDIDTLYSADAINFQLCSTALPLDNTIPAITISIKNLFWGKGQVAGIGAESNDYWYFIAINTIFYGMKMSVVVENMDMVTIQNAAGALLFLNSYGYSSVTPPPHYRIANTQLDIRIHNFYEKVRPGSTAAGILVLIMGNSVSLTEPVVLNTANDNFFTIHFDHANILSQIGFGYGPLFYGRNNYLVFDLGNFYRRTGFVPDRPLLAAGAYGEIQGDTMVTWIKGNITLEDGYVYSGLNDRYNNTIIEGNFRIRNGSSIPVQIAAQEIVAVKNSIIVAPAGASFSISANTAKDLLVSGLLTNKPLDPNITVKGVTPVIDNSVGNYLP